MQDLNQPHWLLMQDPSWVSSNQFTVSGTESLAKHIERKLFQCISSDGLTRRYGFIKTATYLSDVITCTVCSTSNLVSTDINFSFANFPAIDYFCEYININQDLSANALIPQGNAILDLKRDSYFISTDVAVLTGASGAGATLEWNIYIDNVTQAYASHQDMGTSTTDNDNRPTVTTLTTGQSLTLRLTALVSSGTASYLHARLFVVPQALFNTL